MPSIVAVGYPDRGHVLIELNMADVPGAVYACVTAGYGDTVRQLHPYVSYNDAGCIALSCGQAILWDTEAPCDTPVTYCATAVDAAGNTLTEPADPLLTAAFSTAAVASWPPADTGQTWTNNGGAAADYSGTGTRGQHAVPTVNVRRLSTAPIVTANYTATAVGFPTAVATGDQMTQELWVRADATGANGYHLRVRYFPSGNIDLALERVIGGVVTILASAGVVASYGAATGISMELSAHGNQLRGRIWDTTTPVPAYQITATDAAFNAVAGAVGLGSLRSGANTNGGLVFQWDNVSVFDVCADPEPVEVCTEPVTLPCDGCFRLGDPVRPCGDVRICLCVDGVECGGDGGLFFAGMNPDSYPDNAGNMLPVNAVHPIHISRNRRSATGAFTVIPTSFTARDQLLDLLAPGSVLLWRGPGEYGIGDRYLAVGEVPVAPPLADLTQQPRVMQLPFVVENGVTGPSLGVCGARVADLCDVYPTWDAMTAAGVTYADLLRGDAGGVPSGLATWASTNTDNVDWAALDAAQADWSDALDGD